MGLLVKLSMNLAKDADHDVKNLAPIAMTAERPISFHVRRAHLHKYTNFTVVAECTTTVRRILANTA